MLYDVIIVGAGPAGSTVAKNLSPHLNVLLIDDKIFPRNKICGGCVSKAISDYLPEIGSISKVIVKTAILTYKNTACIALHSDEPFAFFVDRFDFDYYLVQKAINSGAKLINERFVDFRKTGDFIDIYTDKNTYKTKYLVGADGANSKVRRVLSIKPKYIVKTISVKVIEDITDRLTIDIGYRNINYAWVFPQNNNNFGIASKSRNIDKIFRNYVKCGYVEKKGFFIPIGFSKENLGRDNILLAGDAACVANPFSLEGILPAIKSGNFTAFSILSSPNNPIDLYKKAMEETLTDNYYAHLISQIVHFMPYIAFSKLSEFGADILMGYLSGKHSSKDIFYTLVRNFFKKS